MGSACPARSWTVPRSTPPSSSPLTKDRRRSCGEHRRTPACWRALKKSQFWAAKMSHSALEERAARRLSRGTPWTDRRAGSRARRCSPERGEAMHEVSKRVRFRALLKGGMSKAAISRELGISRRTATRWAAADDVGRGFEALTYGPRAAGPSVLDPYQEIVRICSNRKSRPLSDRGRQAARLRPWLR